MCSTAVFLVTFKMFNVVIDPLQTPAPLVTVAMSNTSEKTSLIKEDPNNASRLL